MDSRPGPAPGLGPRVGGPWRPWILGGGAVAGAILTFFALGALGVYDVAFVLRNLPSGVVPAETSLELTTVSFVIGFFLAVPLALIRAYGPALLARPTRKLTRRKRFLARIRKSLVAVAYGFASGYVAAVRGTPALVQVFLVYFVFLFRYPRLELLGEPTAFWAGLLALTINTTGYQSEALRGGFQSVEANQVAAARALGLRPSQVFRRVTFPQSLRLVTLPLANEWISNFKTSTVLSYITIVELYGWARTSIAYELGRPVEAFVLLAIFYLTINVGVSRTVHFIEQRRRIPGLGSLTPELPGRREGVVAPAPGVP